MKFAANLCTIAKSGRTPHGVRGLKCIQATPRSRAARSHPARGAWIEIRSRATPPCTELPSRTPHGVRGLKCAASQSTRQLRCRTPHGVRGLKYRRNFARLCNHRSHPARGAWIEMPRSENVGTHDGLSHPARGAWIEIATNRTGTNVLPRRTPHGVRGLKFRTSEQCDD